MAGVRGPLKWPGGKSYLSKRFNATMPPHKHYVEPYFGGGTVLLGHTGEGRSEMANDLDGALTNFWRVLQSAEQFADFHRILQSTPLSRHEYDSAECGVLSRASGLECLNIGVQPAVDFFVFCRQSQAGGMHSFTAPTRTRLRRGMNGNVSEWLSAVDGLPEIHARLRRVMIENMPALDLIRREDTPETLFYLDPPYLHETRRSKDLYAFEMDEKDHMLLLATLAHCAVMAGSVQQREDDHFADEFAKAVEFKLRGKFMLSGYHSPLYDDTAKMNGWHCYEFPIANNNSTADVKPRMIECVWTNFEVAA